MVPPSPPRSKRPKCYVAFFLNQLKKLKEKFTCFFLDIFIFQVFSSTFIFFGVLDHVLRPPSWRYGGGSSTKKIGNPKNQFMFLLLFDFEAVWRSRNLECLYTFLTKAVLLPPCWCYGGGSFMQKDRKSYNGLHVPFYFAIF